MKQTVYRRIFVPSLVILTAIVSGGGLAGMAQEYEQGKGGVDMELICQGPPCIGGPGGPVGPGFAGPGGHGPGGHNVMFNHFMAAPPPPPLGMGPMMLPLHELDLSDEQVEKLAAIKASAADKAGPVMIKLHSLERDYRNALVQPEINSEQVNKIQGQIASQKQALDGIFGDSILASAQVLSVEQRKQLKLKMNRMELGPVAFTRKLPTLKDK